MQGPLQEDWQHWIFTDLQHIPRKTSLALFNLYVPVNLIEKKECWITLSHFIETQSPINIIVAGDLNIIINPEEKKEAFEARTIFMSSLRILFIPRIC